MAWKVRRYSLCQNYFFTAGAMTCPDKEAEKKSFDMHFLLQKYKYLGFCCSLFPLPVMVIAQAFPTFFHARSFKFSENQLSAISYYLFTR